MGRSRAAREFSDRLPLAERYRRASPITIASPAAFTATSLCMSHRDYIQKHPNVTPSCIISPVILRGSFLCSTIQHEKEDHALGRPKGRTLPVRISVGLSPALFRAVSVLANQHSSSVAWVVRRAVAEFVRGGAAGPAASPADDVRRAGDSPPNARARSR